MKLFELHLQGQREPLKVELDCSGIDELADLAGRCRFIVGYFAEADECGCHAKMMIAASRISLAVEVE